MTTGSKASPRWLLELVAIAIGSLVIIVAPRIGAGERGNVETAREWLDGVEYVFGVESNEADLVSTRKGPETEAIVVAEILKVSDPYWNSKSGAAWEGTTGMSAEVYSNVDLRISEVWEERASIIKSGETIQIVVRGDAGTRYEATEQPPYAQVSGGFSPGAIHVLLLRRGALGFESGAVDSWTLSRDFLGNWRVEGSFAFGSHKPLSAPVEELRSSLTDAWRSDEANA